MSHNVHRALQSLLPKNILIFNWSGNNIPAHPTIISVFTSITLLYLFESIFYSDFSVTLLTDYSFALPPLILIMLQQGFGPTVQETKTVSMCLISSHKQKSINLSTKKNPRCGGRKQAGTQCSWLVEEKAENSKALTNWTELSGRVVKSRPGLCRGRWLLVIEDRCASSESGKRVTSHTSCHTLQVKNTKGRGRAEEPKTQTITNNQSCNVLII